MDKVSTLEFKHGICCNNIANKLITSKIKGRCTPFKLLYPPSHFKRERESKQTNKNSYHYKIRTLPSSHIWTQVYQIQLKSAPFTFMGSRP